MNDFGLSERQVLGRVPAHVRITPSKAWPWWYGVYRGDDHRFTIQQETALMKIGRDPVTAPAMLVRREDDWLNPMMWIPDNTWRPIFEFECPVLGAAQGGKIAVIAPSGIKKSVFADGWGHRPSRHPKRTW